MKYEEARVKLANTQLNKLKSEAKNKIVIKLRTTKKQFKKQCYIDQSICFIGDAFRVLLYTHYQAILLSVKFYSYKHIFFKYH